MPDCNPCQLKCVRVAAQALSTLRETAAENAKATHIPHAEIRCRRNDPMYQAGNVCQREEVSDVESEYRQAETIYPEAVALNVPPSKTTFDNFLLSELFR